MYSLINIVLSAKKLKDFSNPRGWMNTILLNNYKNKIAKLTRTKNKEESYDSKYFSGADEPALEDSNNFLNECIDDALQRFALEHPQRAEAIKLRFISDIDLRELSVLIERPYQATRKFISESYKRFRPFAEACN